MERNKENLTFILSGLCSTWVLLYPPLHENASTDLSRISGRRETADLRVKDCERSLLNNRKKCLSPPTADNRLFRRRRSCASRSARRRPSPSRPPPPHDASSPPGALASERDSRSKTIKKLVPYYDKVSFNNHKLTCSLISDSPSLSSVSFCMRSLGGMSTLVYCSSSRVKYWKSAC